MRWVVGLLLMALLGRAPVSLAQEEDSVLEPDAIGEEQAYNQIIARFNKNIKRFASWDAFKAETVAKISPKILGSCYKSTGGSTKAVEVTKIGMPTVADEGWRETRGKGWRQQKKDRTFIEYRVNTKAGVLLWIEGVKPRFFFAHTKKICELPL